MIFSLADLQGGTAFYRVFHGAPFKDDLLSEDHKWVEGMERTPRVSIWVSRSYLGTILSPASRYGSAFAGFSAVEIQSC